MAQSKSAKERTGLYWYQLKELRAIVLFEQDYACGECGCLIGQIQADHHLHHLNGKPKNNNRGNLLVLCPGCHAVMHGYKKTHFDKYQPLYDKNVRGMCSICINQTELKDGLCFKCHKEHYSVHKEGKATFGL